MPEPTIWGWPPDWVLCRLGRHDWQCSPPTPRQKRDYCNATAQLYWLGDVPKDAWDRACLRCNKVELRVNAAVIAAQQAYQQKVQNDDAEWKRVIERTERETTRTKNAHTRIQGARRRANGVQPGRLSVATDVGGELSEPKTTGGELSEADEHIGALSEFDARLYGGDR